MGHWGAVKHHTTGGLSVGFVVVVLAVMLSAGLPAASANWFGETGRARSVNDDYRCGGPNMTQSKDVDFGFSPDMTAEAKGAVNYTRDELLDPTDINTSVVDDYGPHIDVLVTVKDYDTWCVDLTGYDWATAEHPKVGLAGLTNCETKASGSPRCDKANVRLSDIWMDAANQSERRYLACHEIGHAIGLMHRDAAAGCMVKCAYASTPVYTSHDVAHFNADWNNQSASGTEPTC